MGDVVRLDPEHAPGALDRPPAAPSTLAARLPLADQLRLVLAGLPERVRLHVPQPGCVREDELAAALKGERARADMLETASRGAVEVLGRG